MAVLARRNWSQMLTELQLRVGNYSTTGFDVRLQHLLTASYHHICTTYHHTELDKTDSSVTCSTSTNEITLPSDLFILVAIRLRSTGSPSTYLGPILIEDFRSVSGHYTAETARPEKGGRFGSKFYFDKLPDAAYPLDILYYRHGLAPDFSGSPTSPELGPDVDEHILEGALRLAWPALARPDLGGVHRELLTEWLGSQIRPTTMFPLTDLPERERSATILSGTQG